LLRITAIFLDSPLLVVAITVLLEIAVVFSVIMIIVLVLFRLIVEQLVVT
jgi:hypothetical protein